MRYLAHTDETRQAMLKEIGVQSVDDLFTDVPPQARLAELLDLPLHQHELDVERAFQSWASDNRHASDGPFFLGAGAYRHHIPASVDALIQRGEFLTSYTPYQPEIAQGTLQYLFEFQTQVALLTGMEVANASMYDGATATAEAVLMANRITGRKNVILSGALHPHYAETIETYGRFSGYQIDRKQPPLETPENLISSITDQISCVVVQYPDFFGTISNFTALADTCHKHGALLIVAVTEIVALGLIQPPGAMGADIVTGDGQSLGVGLNFGGPTVGLFATKTAYLRQMPGRVVGQTDDKDGKRGWVLTLSTREQHIRREKATSNICTNAGLCALAFTIHVTLLGEEGLRRLAKLNHQKTIQLAEFLKKIPGVQVLNSTFFNELLIKLPKPAAEIVEYLARHNILGGVPLSRLYPNQFPNYLLVAVTEMVSDRDQNIFIDGLQMSLDEEIF